MSDDDAALTQARHAVIEGISPEAMVDAAGVAANFERMVRIADATGIPLDARMAALSQEVRDSTPSGALHGVKKGLSEIIYRERPQYCLLPSRSESGILLTRRISIQSTQGARPRQDTQTGAVLMSTSDTTSPSHFIRDIIAEDRRQNKHGGRVVTRFSRSQRLSAYWARQVHLPQFRSCRRE